MSSSIYWLCPLESACGSFDTLPELREHVLFKHGVKGGSGSGGYIYSVVMAPTAVTAAKTLIQVKTGAAPVDLLDARIYQVTKTSSELLAVQLHQYIVPTAGTVTSVTPLKSNHLDPAALAVGGTSATGTNASAEPSGGTDNLVYSTNWNVLNGEWYFLDIPEGRIRAAQGGDLITLKLNTAPAASMTIGAVLRFIEYQ